MSKRAMILIDETKCNGCGLCVPSCAEGALQIVDGKAKVVLDQYCDGLGACLGECPQGALTIEQREAVEFDAASAMEHVRQLRPKAAPHHSGGGCPGSRAMVLPQHEPCACASSGGAADSTSSALAQWPVQLHLVPVAAPFFRNSDLLVTADCVPFAAADYHRVHLAGHSVAVGCPKLDETDSYVEKLAQIIQRNSLKSITVVIMEVPCCRGMAQIVKAAVALSGVELRVKEVVVSLQGQVIREGWQ